jgi:hypothetical protein
MFLAAALGARRDPTANEEVRGIFKALVVGIATAGSR